MISNAMIAQVAALAGDPARAAMLHELMDGRALTASELARVAGITPQTASGHLAQMTAAGLLTVEKQGRHRYHKLASAAVAQMMESIMQVAADRPPLAQRLSVGPRDAAMRAARTCYDHLAGRLGVAITDAMVDNGYLELAPDAGLVTEFGRQIPCQHRHRHRQTRSAARQKLGARAVPAVSRLERAATASRRRRRRGHLPALLRQRLGAPRCGNAGSHDHAKRSTSVPRAVRRANWMRASRWL